jgi:predicted TIM-barrel fold metal-dependent hydrolase
MGVPAGAALCAALCAVAAVVTALALRVPALALAGPAAAAAAAAETARGWAGECALAMAAPPSKRGARAAARATVPAALAPELAVVDTATVLGDPAQLTRRGALGLELLSWLPEAARTTLVAQAVMPRAHLLALGGDPVAALGRWDRARLEAAVNESGHAVIAGLALEGASRLAAEGHGSNAQAHLMEARWMAEQAAAPGHVRLGLIVSAGGEELAQEARAAYLGQALALGGVRGARYTAAHSHARGLHSWARSGDSAAHLRSIDATAAALKRAHARAPGLLLELDLFHWQLGLAAQAARRHPELRVVVAQAGGPLGCRRPLADCADYWDGLERLAQQPNAYLKLSGLAAHTTGLGYLARPNGVDEDTLVRDWTDTVRFAVRHFGPRRVVFGTNAPFDVAPVDGGYGALWNAIKRIVLDAFDLETCRRLLSVNALELYALEHRA